LFSFVAQRDIYSLGAPKERLVRYPASQTPPLFYGNGGLFTVSPGPCLWAGIPPSVAPRPAQSPGRVRRSSQLPPLPFAFSAFASILSLFLPSLRTSSSFHSSGRPGVDRPSSLHLRIIGGCTTSPPHHWRLHHFTSASWEAASLHLRIIGGCTTSPPHHGRLHHFTSASWEASSLHLRIIGGCIIRPAINHLGHHLPLAPSVRPEQASSVRTHR